jgi:protein-tyrosine kinase
MEGATVLNPREVGPAGRDEGNALDGQALCTMEHLYDSFYKVLWKILVKAARQNGGEGKKLNGRKLINGAKERRPGYAMTFAGCREGDGASTMALNFACAFASYSSKSVLLVDGNLRNPVLHLQFTTKGKGGLTDLVEGTASIAETVTEVAPNKFYFLQSGAKFDSPIMLYESAEFLRVMEQLRATYELIIFDSPSLVDNPESTLLAAATDGLVMVLQAEKTRWEVALSARRDLEDAQVPVIGAVLNKKHLVIPEPLYRLL